MRKNNKSGFTLAEILITLSIVGIVAAATIPQIVAGVNKNTAGAALARGVKQMETGCHNILETANSRLDDGSHFTSILSLRRFDVVDSNDGRIVYPQLFNDYSSFFGTERLNNANSYKADIKGYENGQSEEWVTRLNNLDIFADKKSNIYYALTIAMAGHLPYMELSTDIQDKFMDYIFIDVNGNKKPNRFGQDIFLFGLTDRCKMIPAGSATMNDTSVGGTGHDLATDACTDGNITDGLSCTARVVKDGYKITY